MEQKKNRKIRGKIIIQKFRRMFLHLEIVIFFAVVFNQKLQSAFSVNFMCDIKKKFGINLLRYEKMSSIEHKKLFEQKKRENVSIE